VKFEQPVPLLVGARQARHFDGEHGADRAHGDIVHQGFEVVAIGDVLARLAEIAVEDPDAVGAPAQPTRFGAQLVLALGTFLVEAHLTWGRLTQVDAGLAVQVVVGNLRHRHRRIPPVRLRAGAPAK